MLEMQSGGWPRSAYNAAMTDSSIEVSGDSPLRPKRGLSVNRAEGRVFDEAIEAAVDYRGDITLKRASTGEEISGYLFDCTDTDDPASATLRLLPPDGGRIAVPATDVTTISFSGRDTAEGKSFETWVKKYVERKLAGKPANIEPDETEDE
jgi:hypothetical protein